MEILSIPFILPNERQKISKSSTGFWYLDKGLKSVLNSSDFEFKNYVSHLTETYLDSIYKTVTLYYSQETPPPNFIS